MVVRIAAKGAAKATKALIKQAKGVRDLQKKKIDWVVDKRGIVRPGPEYKKLYRRRTAWLRSGPITLKRSMFRNTPAGQKLLQEIVRGKKIPIVFNSKNRQLFNISKKKKRIKRIRIRKKYGQEQFLKL